MSGSSGEMDERWSVRVLGVLPVASELGLDLDGGVLDRRVFEINLFVILFVVRSGGLFGLFLLEIASPQRLVLEVLGSCVGIVWVWVCGVRTVWESAMRERWGGARYSPNA